MNDEGLLEVANALPQLINVDNLAFDWNPAISDTAISGLVRALDALNGRTVSHLILNGIGIGNEGALALTSYLADGRAPATLDLRGDAIPVDGVAKLAEAAVAAKIDTLRIF